MVKQITKIPISDIILDEEIYPREKIDQEVALFLKWLKSMGWQSQWYGHWNASMRELYPQCKRREYS